MPNKNFYLNAKFGRFALFKPTIVGGSLHE
jgi:hypothetical protein